MEMHRTIATYSIYIIGSKFTQPIVIHLHVNVIVEVDTGAIFSLTLDCTHKTMFTMHQCPLAISMSYTEIKVMHNNLAPHIFPVPNKSEIFCINGAQLLKFSDVNYNITCQN